MAENQIFSVTGLKNKNTTSLLSIILADQIIVGLAGGTKEIIINELLDKLAAKGKLFDRTTALKDLLDREQTMSTAIPNGIAIPHAKTTAVQELTIAIGIKKSDLESHLDSEAHIIIHSFAPMEQGIVIKGRSPFGV